VLEPPKNIDVIMVAPKESGLFLRRNFFEGKSLNGSFAIFQDYTGKAEENVLALGIAIGLGYLFPTTFEKEAFSDLVGKRGVDWSDRWDHGGTVYSIMSLDDMAIVPVKHSMRPLKSLLRV